ncbi:MAG: hypothetical protein KJN60_13460 [Boseongicola sp.]|nr:hypothetical protein [Boseongicola sp.]
MATTVATLVYLTVLLLSFFASRELVTKRGTVGALGLAICWLAVLALFAYASALVPFAPLDQSLSYALAQMVFAGSILGIPAGFFDRWRKRTNKE